MRKLTRPQQDLYRLFITDVPDQYSIYRETKSEFCYRKFVIYVALTVQIGILIWSQIFVSFNETAFQSQKRARSSINTAGQG